MPHPFFGSPEQRPLILGHRGAAGTTPENTLVSFECGLESGAHILESDVHLSRDGVPILLHDPEVDRTSDGRGSVADLDLAAIQALDAGYRFSPDEGKSFPYRAKGLTIPTLEEAFRRFPGARFNLELKTGGPLVAERVVGLVKDLGRANRTLLTAGDDALMDEIVATAQAQGTDPALGACTRDAADFARAAAAGTPPPAIPMALQIPAAFAGRSLITPQLIAHAHAHDVQIHAWTINEEEEMTRLLDLGVDGLVTDLPARMRDLLRQRTHAGG